jgi:hypothetical protein
MAKGQLNGNREIKKPMADGNKIKTDPSTLPFAFAWFPGKPTPGSAGKKTP